MYGNEIEVMKALGIDSFRNLSRDNVLRFAAMMPDIDKDVALKIVEQYPEFKAFAVDALNAIERVQENALASNEESQADVHQGWHEVREILNGQLDDEKLAWEQRSHILDLLMETGHQESAKDSEKEMSRNVLTGIGALVLVGLVLVGGRVRA
jgi:hypothetical protein